MTGPLRRPRHLLLLVVLVLTTVVTAVPSDAQTGTTSREIRYVTSDGVELQATLTGPAPLTARPVIVEFSPYGQNTATLNPGPDYNFLLVQIRGTGASDGSFDALGPRTQMDVAEVLDWACEQEWSNGELGLNGFSASAIAIYNSLHLDLPCVKGAVLKSGTYELYRDLIYPGGLQNLVPVVTVLGLIGGTTAIQAPDRLDGDPATWLDVVAGQIGSALTGREHDTLDPWWAERGFRGDVNDIPILMIGGFFDVESRGAFEAFQELRDDGAHLMVIGAHDGAPAGTDGGVGTARAWLDRYVQDIPNGVDDEPPVQLWLADGSYGDLQEGRFVRVDAENWPAPDTRWTAFALDPARSGSATSINDGTLTTGDPGPEAQHTYPAVVSLPNATDPHNFSNAGASGDFAYDMRLAEPLGLSWTTEPFAEDVIAAGPASFEIRLSSTAPETGMWVTLTDVAPDGTVNPVGSGRLLSSFPHVDDARSLHDPASGDIVQPYGVYHPKDPAAVGEERFYRVEIWPIGNRFRAGHRLRVHLTGTSALYLPLVPGLNTVTVGGDSGSRLLLPVLGGFTAPAPTPDVGVSNRGAPSGAEASSPAASLPATGGEPLLAAGVAAIGGALVLRRRQPRVRESPHDQAVDQDV